MGGWGGDFILESGNDCDGQREKDREGGEKGRGDADEEEDEGGQQTKENRKEKNVRRMKSNQLSNQASKDEKIRSNPKNRSQ